jgi:catechol 2,3-dioxygenase-like lactoylglutathione lyase family enzyme
MSSSPRLLTTEPVFVTRDIDATEAFYTGKLGFETSSRHDDYLIMTRDDITLHFSLCPDCDPALNTCHAYVRVTGIEALYDVYRPLDIIHPNAELTVQTYGAKEFAVIDPDFNLITFGEPVGEHVSG